ncbi:MAG: adenylosuccinate lyase [Suipraeoptans sp.]
MASFVIDSKLFKDQYGTKEMREVFSDEMLMQKWLDTWTALAQSEADLGVIPQSAATEIKEKAKWENIDFDEVREGFLKTSHPLMPQIRCFEKACSKESGGYIHWGATTQDIMDTAVVLQMKDAHAILVKQVQELLDLCLDKAKKYQNLTMAGRTHGQHALPITLGYKIAIWADEFGRHLERLETGKHRYLVGQLAGAAGTLASLGDDGIKVQKGMCELLGLEVPVTTWHVARDGFAEFSSVVSMIAGTVGKIANEFINLERTEIAEIEESFAMGKVGSSTMPHKRNPMVCENIVATVRIVQANAALSFGAMIQEHERDMTFWQTEWSYIPQICIMLDGAIDMMKVILNAMIVHEDKISENLFMTKGLIVSERIMLVLGRYLGRQDAHEVIYEGSMKAFEQNMPLVDILLEDERVTSKIEEDVIRDTINPMNYVGACAEFVDRAVEKWGTK